MASATQSQKRSKRGRFVKGGELNRRKLCAEKLRVVIPQCSEGEKEPVNTMCERSEDEVSWDDGRRVVELGMLAEGLESCCFCQQPIQLKYVVDEKRYGLASLLYIHCSCGQINTVRTGKSHRSADAHRGVPIYDVNTKLATGR